MERSESIINIAKALEVFHGQVASIPKDAKNPFFKSNYASLPAIQDAIRLPLAEARLVYTQLPSGVNGLCTMLIHAPTGEYFMDTYTMPVSKPNDPQAVGSAITYAKRYALVAILGLTIDDDDDGNKAAEKPTGDQRPWLSEKAFNQALERIRKKDREVFQKTVDAFRISEGYLNQLKAEHEEIEEAV